MSHEGARPLLAPLTDLPMGWADRHLRPTPTKRFRADRSQLDWPRQESDGTSRSGAKTSWVFLRLARPRTK